MKVFLINIPSLICYGLAAFLAYNDKEGWGWMIFAGIVLTHTVSSEPSSAPVTPDEKEGA